MKSLIQHELRMNDRPRNAMRAAQNAGFRLIAGELRIRAPISTRYERSMAKFGAARGEPAAGKKRPLLAEAEAVA